MRHQSYRPKLPMRPRKCPSGKVRHPTEGAARAEADRLKRAGAHRPERGELAAFRCCCCSCWHLGHVARERGVG